MFAPRISAYALWAAGAVLVQGACNLPGSGRGRPAEAAILVDGDPLVRGAEEGAIPAVNEPKFVRAAEAESFMKDDEPVVGIAPDGEPPRAYSTWYLDSHEVVNDRLRRGPLLVTW